MGNSSCKECLSELDDPQANTQFSVLEGLNGDRGKYNLRYKWVDDKLIKVDETASGSRHSAVQSKGPTPPFPDYEIMCDAPVDHGGEPRGFTLSLSAIKPDAADPGRNMIMETGELRDFTRNGGEQYTYGHVASYGQPAPGQGQYGYHQQASYPPLNNLNGRRKY